MIINFNIIFFSSPSILPPLICDEGSTGITATLFFFLISFMPKFSIKVDFPAPNKRRKKMIPGKMNESVNI